MIYHINPPFSIAKSSSLYIYISHLFSWPQNSIANRYTSPDPRPFNGNVERRNAQALEAQKQGWFKEEIVPVTIETKGKERPSKGGLSGDGPLSKNGDFSRNPWGKFQ
jgi:hypothetical protein